MRWIESIIGLCLVATMSAAIHQQLARAVEAVADAAEGMAALSAARNVIEETAALPCRSPALRCPPGLRCRVTRDMLSVDSGGGALMRVGVTIITDDFNTGSAGTSDDGDGAALVRLNRVVLVPPSCLIDDGPP